LTGPEHYREAERRLRMAWEEDSTPERSAHLVAEAQVHAALAQVAAFVSSQPLEGHQASGGFGEEDWDEWMEAFHPATNPSITTEEH